MRWIGGAHEEEATMQIELLNASLAERPDEITQKQTVVALGFLKPSSLGSIRVDDYQREILIPRRSTNIYEAVKRGAYLPPITIGIRSANFESDGSTMLLPAETYVIDGLQRKSAIEKCYAEDSLLFSNYQIGADVRFSTTFDLEKQLFHILNLRRTSLSPNIILRNMRDKFTGIATLYGLSFSDTDFALYNRVQWCQRSGLGDLLTAMTLLRTGIELYNHVTVSAGAHADSPPDETGRRGGAHRHSPDGGAVHLQNKIKIIGLNNFRMSMIHFMDVVDQCWGVRNIETSASRPQTKGAFLHALAMVLSEHKDFWKGYKLNVPNTHRERLKQLPLAKLTLKERVSGGYVECMLLSQIIIRHLNRGRSQHKLHSRAQDE
jgi:hypothetical protein